jgi:sigma-B regulation protein RsbU (phosphoserine phosphatase)
LLNAFLKKPVSTFLFAGSLALVVIALAVYFSNILAWANYPDFGFGWRSAWGVRIVGVVSDHGRQAGLQIGDEILTVNGQKFVTTQDFKSAMNRDLGDRNTYRIKRVTDELEINIINVPSGFANSFNRSGFPFLLGGCYISIGTLVFLMKPHWRSSWIFFLLTATFGIFFAFLYHSGTMQPRWLETVHIFTYVFTPAAIIHLALVFPEERRFVRHHPTVQLCPYVVALTLFAVIRMNAPAMYDASRALIYLAVGYLVVSAVFFWSSCLQLRFTSKSAMARLRSRIILLGSAITLLVPTADFVGNAYFDLYFLPNFNYYLPFFLAFPIAVGYSIVKHDLFDIDAIIKRTYGYLLTTGTLAGIYGLFVLASNLVFGGFEASRSPLFPVVFILAVVFLFNPVKNSVQRVIDRVFYRLEYDYQATVQKISETMRSILNLDQVGRAVMDTALGTLFVDHGYVLLLERDGKTYDCLVEAGIAEKKAPAEGPPPSADANMACGPELFDLKLPSEEPLIRKMAETGKELTIYDIEEDPAFEESRDACRRTFERMQAQLLVPLIYENRLTGLIALGRKKSGKFYRREDINLLNVLANQGAVAIENARMVAEVVEKERMEEELSIARDLQISMLPAECPQVAGYRIAAYSMAAREVGGDFYDFIQMDGQRLGMLIGDVTGKSVSGALVMSASRSVFRMLSEEDLTVAGRMMRANRRLKKDLKTGMFVALLYAVLDGEKNTLALCSAGQTQPVKRDTATGSTGLIETRGDAFPLGILEEAEYAETLLPIAPGDVIVLYTDGVVEAMNTAGEIFGFERLIEGIGSSHAASAEALLQEILAHVNAFAAGAPQHDDLTMIVVRAD